MTWPGVVGRGLLVMVVTTVLTLTAWTVVPLLWGWQAYTVTSGSMAPLVRPGDVVLASPGIGAGPKVGQVVVIAPATAGGQPVTHRIVERLPDGRFRTRGDANAQADSRLVAKDQLIGLGRVVVPLAGLVRLHGGRVAPALAGLAVIVFALTRRRRPRPPTAGQPRRTATEPRRATSKTRRAAVGPSRAAVHSDDPPAQGGPSAQGGPAVEDRPVEKGDSSQQLRGRRKRVNAHATKRKRPRGAVRKRRGTRRRNRPRAGVALLAVLGFVVITSLARPGTGAVYSAISPTQANAWKSSYFYTAAVKASAPVSYWRMGGASTTSVADEMGTVPLALYGTPVVGAAGAVSVDPNTATKFKNGTGRSYAGVTSAAHSISGPMTVAAWTDGIANTNWRLVFKGGPGTNKLNYLLSWSSDSGVDMRFLVDAGGVRQEVKSKWPTTGGYHFVVGVYDGTAAKLYIDGVMTATKAAGGTLAVDTTLPLTVSEDNASTGLNGSVDEVAIWSRALTDTQISTFYALARQ
ncbi:hypothetical protein GCM10010435_36760 [Winogradskya consettensis]|uniref:Signal peptidase I n=1 Tax=Winogradskya consettensis TaxID=113560 RepID=A0A919W5Y9_9ACTN|nr:signal peptidase I [Actinoplanes consettensis]GIM81620.1 hypothetical protein Aco04nite_77490 [Actinoplanes consettensis]